MSYLSFRLCNLVIPGDPAQLDIRTPSGVWEITQGPDPAASKKAIQDGKIAETHVISQTVVSSGGSRAVSVDAAFDELIPICLAASYLSGNSVAVTRSAPMSEVTIMEVGSHFPRPRTMVGVGSVVSNEVELQERVEAFVNGHQTSGAAEKDRLLVHHWLDALACWSLEDLCLSTATLFEIIVATAKGVARAAGQNLTTFDPRIQFAASRFGLPSLSTDFRNMRNDLVHEGSLSGTRFPNKAAIECSTAASEALEWFDNYAHAALNLGPVIVNRFPPRAYAGLNAFSLN